MKNFALHIFGYGETQINGDEFSIKLNTSELTKVKPIVDAVWALKPESSDAEVNFRAITFFGFRDFNYMSKKGFSLNTTPELKVLIEALIEELRVVFETPTE